MNIFIYAYPYDENSGGIIALHRLCHIINEKTDHKAYLVSNAWSYSIWKKFRYKFKKSRIFTTKDNWNTPIWSGKEFPDNAVVIYPEVVKGNPLGIKHVVRWLLHQPGFHTGQIHYGENELYFKFNSAINDFQRESCTLAQHEMKVIYYPIDTYANRELSRDIDCCYMVRKGTDKSQVHPANAVCLDGKSHTEIAEIFNRARQFICYDDYTAYSLFAVLSGCESIVVPAEGVSLLDWYPNTSDRYGLAYGFSEEERAWAAQTKDKVLEHILHEHKNVEHSVQICLEEIAIFLTNKED